MANVFAIHSVGQSLATYLNKAYPESLRAEHGCSFELVSSSQINTPPDDNTRVTLFLYRVTVNEHLRNQTRGNGRHTDVPLSVDLHFLVTAWGSEPLREQVPLAWAMRQLHQHPVLDSSSLSPEANWDSGDVVQLLPAELSTEDIMRIWDALSEPYRLSVSYIARVVRIDPDEPTEARPVVDRRIQLTERGARP